MTTLFDFDRPVPPEDTVVVGPNLIRNWQLAINTARECCMKYGHALLESNGSPEAPATLWRVRRVVG